MSGKTAKAKRKAKQTAAPERGERRSASTPLPGWPGYRTRDGRSGLDPVDNDIEGGHVVGVFLRRFFTMTLRTHHAYQTALLGVLGFLLVAPFVLAVTEAVGGGSMTVGMWVYLSLVGLVGLFALTNCVKNLLRARKPG